METPAPPARTDAATGLPTTTATLERRRRKLWAAKAAADSAAAAVVALDDQLDTSSNRRRGQEAALRAALDRVATLKKAIKASSKASAKLRGARKRARLVSAKARQHAATAEDRYDRAVLADMLRREKDHDLSVHAPEGGEPDTGSRGRALDGEAAADRGHRTTGAGRRRTETTRAAGSVSGPGAGTARETAARTTAARAHASSPSARAGADGPATMLVVPESAGRKSAGRRSDSPDS